MLQILDMSCCSAPDADEVAKCIARSCPPERCPRVWDLTRPAHVEDALHVVNVGWRELGLERESMRTMASAMACCSNSSRRTPLHVAVELNDARMVKSLLQLGANVNARDRSGATPTFLAAENGKIEALDALMSSENVDARIANSAGETPLYISALRGHLSVVSILLEHFRAQNISWYDPHMYTDGWTPLMAAAVADHDKVANLLLQAAIMSGGLQAFLNAANRYGQTALHIAARRGFKNFIALLISKGADPQVRDCYGLTAFEVAKGNRQENVVVALC